MTTQFDPNKPLALPGVAGPVSTEGDDLSTMLAELGLSQSELDRLSAKKARLDASGRPVKREVGVVPGSNQVIFDPGNIIANWMDEYRYMKDLKSTDKETAAVRDKQAAARAKVADRIPGLDDAQAARIAASTQDESVLNALQMIRQRNAEERGNTRADTVRQEERAARDAEKAADRAARDAERAEERTWNTDERAKDRESRRAELAAQLEAQGLAQQREAGVKAGKEQKAAQSAYNTWEQARSQLSQSFKKLGSGTGTLEGLVPAMGEETRAVESDRANMAPVLKGLFRASGEGAWSDKEQAALMAMLPSRQDSPRAADEKLSRIDAIIQQKLSMAQPVRGTSNAPALPRPNGQGGMTDAGPQGWRIQIKPSQGNQ